MPDLPKSRPRPKLAPIALPWVRCYTVHIKSPIFVQSVVGRLEGCNIIWSTGQSITRMSSITLRWEGFLRPLSIGRMNTIGSSPTWTAGRPTSAPERESYCWLTGEAPTEKVREDDGQWVWAVLSGFQKDIPLSRILKYPLPYADGNGGFWQNPISMQHPLLTVAIVAVDGYLTLIYSREESMVKDFLRFFPHSQVLSEYNAR